MTIRDTRPAPQAGTSRSELARWAACLLVVLCGLLAVLLGPAA